MSATGYVTGAERIEKLTGLKPDTWALVQGEVTDCRAIYAYQVQPLSPPQRLPGHEDAYLAGMQAS